jgi:hypothetical protein
MNTKYFFLQKVFLPEISRYILSFLPKYDIYFIDSEFEDILKTQLLDCREKNGCRSSFSNISYFDKLRLLKSDLDFWTFASESNEDILYRAVNDYMYSISFCDGRCEDDEYPPWFEVTFKIQKYNHRVFTTEEKKKIYNLFWNNQNHTILKVLKKHFNISDVENLGDLMEELLLYMNVSYHTFMYHQQDLREFSITFEVVKIYDLDYFENPALANDVITKQKMWEFIKVLFYYWKTCLD